MISRFQLMQQRGWSHFWDGSDVVLVKKGKRRFRIATPKEPISKADMEAFFSRAEAEMDAIDAREEAS